MSDVPPGGSALLFFLAAFISMFGSELNGIAVEWHVIDTTGRKDWLSWILAVPVLLAIVSLPYTGVLLDRFDRRRFAIALDMLRASVVFVTPVGILLGLPELPAVAAMSIAVNFFTHAYWPNAGALVQEVGRTGRAVRYSSFFALSVQSGTFIAGILVGLLYDVGGLSLILVLDGLTYIASITCLFHLRRGRHAPRERTPEESEVGAWRAFLSDLREGLAYLRSARAVLAVGVVHGVLLAAVFGLHVLTAPINRDVFHAGVRAFGLCNCAWGLGALVGSQLAPLLVFRANASKVLMGGILLLAASCLAIPVCPTYLWGMVAFLGMGIGRGVAGVVIFSRILQNVPRRVMGRVQSTFQTIGLTFRVVVILTVGYVAELASLTLAILGVVGLLVLAVVAIWSVRKDAVFAVESSSPPPAPSAA